MTHMLFAPTGLLAKTPQRSAKHDELRAELAADRLDRVKKHSRPAQRRKAHHTFKQTAERAA